MNKFAIASLALVLSLVAEAATRAELLRAKFDSSDTNYVFVIAHRADWRHHPENSIAAIEGAIALGADMVEIDVAKTKDGVHVLSHDGKLDRVSDRKGAIKDLTLAEVKSARLRMGQGGAEAALTDERVPTLVEALEACRGKILVNIDKFYVDPNGITDIIQKLGVAKQVVLKGHGDYGWVKQSTGEPWKHVEKRDFIYMPIVSSGKTSAGLADARKACAAWAASPYAPPAYEVCVPGDAPLALFADFRTSPSHPRLWINTLWDSLAHGHSESLVGADFAPDKVWGHWIGLGATMIQTDDPAALVGYLASKRRHTLSPAPQLSFDSTSILVDGQRTYLVSGEFHYFRVPQTDWRRRMRLFKDVGGNCLATYIPWIVHEPEEGKIVFGDQPARDLDLFLRTAKEEGLMVIARPGPYQYSELRNNGLPTWLVEKYPEILTKKADGSIVGKGSVDYNHPTFLAKARPYFRAVAKVLKPHLAANGGPVVLTQLDNELTGIHVWFGYQPTEAYYADCGKYLETLKKWLAEDGIGGPYCHNAGGAQMSASYKTCADRLGNKDFLLGYDHYYGLFQNEREAPVPYYFFDALFACDILRGWGYPPVGFEIQCGTIGDVPPILKEDLLAAHMLNLAAGMKGINYYVFTGGPNFPGTAAEPDMEMYDYQAPVGPDGTVRPTYEALREFGTFVKDHPEFLEAERLTSVRVGQEWQHAALMAPFDYNFNRFGMFYALMQTDYAPEYYLLDDEIPLDGKPLVLAGVTSMSAEAQMRVAAYVKKGGKLLVAPDFPRVDLAGKPCEILAAVSSRPPYQDGKSVVIMNKTWKTQFFAQGERVAKILAEFGAKPVVRSSNRNVFTTAFRLADGRTGVFALNLRSGAQETVVSLPTGDAAALRLAPMSVRYRILSPMTLKDRVRLSARRLEDGRYSPERVFLTEEQSGGWPGDTEGRTILALVLQQAALGEKPKHLDAILRALPAHLNEKGYMGPVREGVLDEQQLSGNGWMLRGLCAYAKCEKNPVIDVKPLIRSIAHNLFLPGRGKYATYPISPDGRGEKGAASGTVAETKDGWRLSSDIGCLFIGLDGLVEARQVLDDPSLDPVIEEMIARFLEIDLVGIRAQTHASLTALRALLRYDAKRFLPEVEKRFDLYVRHGMTDDFANFNWFGRTDTWTEPCAIADSYLVARQLFAATGRTVYRDYAEKFLAALCAHQRANGGFGLRKTFPQGTYREPVEQCDEATWCCTMRGGAALAAALW